jgi:predicted DNA-binding transcriptional regulator AlpA
VSAAAPDELRLAPESIEALATRLAELLGASAQAPPEEHEGQMLSAAEVSRRWGVSRRWIYDHAEALGAVRLGAGPRPRLRFDPVEVAERLGSPVPAPRPPRADVRGSAGSGQRPRSDSLSPPGRAMFVESQIAAGGRANAPGPASEKELRRAPEPILDGRPRRPLPTERRRGGGR